MNANHMTIGFIGLGLIGGSIAKTIRRIHPDSIIYGFDTDIDSLKMAKEDGTLTQYFETLDSTFSSCDIIFLCAPVSNNIEYLKELKGIISESCLLTDVGSVKEPIQSAIKELGMESNFIGGHPMVGSEKSGYAHANDHLLENAYYFLTPSRAHFIPAYDKVLLFYSRTRCTCRFFKTRRARLYHCSYQSCTTYCRSRTCSSCPPRRPQ